MYAMRGSLHAEHNTCRNAIPLRSDVFRSVIDRQLAEVQIPTDNDIFAACEAGHKHGFSDPCRHSTPVDRAAISKSPPRGFQNGVPTQVVTSTTYPAA